ncbi:MAG: AAA family ATPase [bacterium]
MQQEWRLRTRGTILNIHTEDIHGDTYPEVRISVSQRELFVLDNEGQLLWKKSFGTDITDIRLSKHEDIHLCISTKKGALYSLNKKGEVLWRRFYNYCSNTLKKTVTQAEERIFFERKYLIRFIKTALNADEENKKIVLLGYQGTGKTFFLSQVNRAVADEKYCCAYIPIKAVALECTEHFLWEFFYHIYSVLKEKELLVSFPSKDHFLKDYRSVCSAFIKTIDSLLHKERVLILLDNFQLLQEKASQGQLGAEIFLILDEMIQTQKFYLILTTSNYTLYRKRKSDFLYNAIIQDISFIEREESRFVLSHTVGRYIPHKQKDAVIASIVDNTGCHILLLQITIRIISLYRSEKKTRYITGNDLDTIYPMIMKEAEKGFEEIWRTCTPYEQILISLLSRLPVGLATISGIENELGIWAPLILEYQCADTLKQLAQKSILKESFINNDISYEFFVPLFRKWVAHKANPFQLLRENAKTMLHNLPLPLFSYQNSLIKNSKQLTLFLSTINCEKKRWNILVTLSQKWSALLNAKGKINNNAISDFVHYLALLLGFSIKKIFQNNQFICFRFKTVAIRLKKLGDMILVIPLNKNPQESDQKSLMGIISDLDVACNVLLILLLENSDIFEKLVLNSKLDIVLLNKNNLKKIFLAENYINTFLNDVVLQYIDLVDLSPYETMGPVDSMFFGRLEEIKTIRQLSHKSFAIIGARQLGKTSLMLKAGDIIKHDAKVRILYLDCSTYNDPLKLCQTIIEKIDHNNNKKIETIDEFKRILHTWNRINNLKLALFLDEIDTLLAIDKEYEEILFKSFRSLFQEKIISLVVAGYEELFLRTKDITSPLFNYLELIKLSSLDEKAATQLITEPMKELGVRLEDEMAIVKEINKTTAYFPNLIQYLCKNLIQLIASQNRRVIYLPDIQYIVTSPDFQDYVLDRFFLHLSSLGKVILLLIAEFDEITMALMDTQLKKHNIYLQQHELHTEVEKFIMVSIFFKTERGLKFTMPYFASILRQNIEKELLIKQLLREVKNEVCQSV